MNREGHQFTRHTVSFHAPDRGGRRACSRGRPRSRRWRALRRAWRRLAAAQEGSRTPKRSAAERNEALEAAREEIGARQKARHDAQIEQLKLAQARGALSRAQRAGPGRARRDRSRDRARATGAVGLPDGDFTRRRSDRRSQGAPMPTTALRLRFRSSYEVFWAQFSCPRRE